MRPMPDRLAIITHEYYPVLSGGTVFTEKLAEELGTLGWEVDILTARIGGSYPKVEARSKAVAGPSHRRQVPRAGHNGERRYPEH